MIFCWSRQKDTFIEALLCLHIVNGDGRDLMLVRWFLISVHQLNWFDFIILRLHS